MSTFKFPREKSLKMSYKFSVEEFPRPASDWVWEKFLRLSSRFGFRKIPQFISSIFPTKMDEVSLKIFYGKFSESGFNFIRKFSDVLYLCKSLKNSSTFPVEEILNSVSRFSIKNLSNLQSPVLLWKNLLDWTLWSRSPMEILWGLFTFLIDIVSEDGPSFALFFYTGKSLSFALPLCPYPSLNIPPLHQKSFH